MDIKKIYRRFFYLNTGSSKGRKPTIVLSSHEAFFVLAICAILKKILFPTVHVGFPLFFSFFMILCLTIEYFNRKMHKRFSNVFRAEWKSESRRHRIRYRICNIVFVILVFSICIYILEYLDNRS
ncbi:hypothetical protein C8C83_0371 [Flavobacterium sp. 90]|nr:hypothetical protein C8C82_0666 [Flavobacterium sp. 81]TCK52569.1 hypothetical protein C8C83_0371 [Flavobacterium sp. 90]